MESRNAFIPIGAFAARTRLSLKALRLYDKLDLLKPIHTDPDSGYRYYSPEQEKEAKLIFLMRRIEMPLVEIRNVLQATDSEASDMLQRYQRDFQCRFERNRRLLGDLLALLRNEELQMNFEVRTERVSAQTIASIEKRVRIGELEDHIHRSIGKLQSSLGDRIAGSFFGIYHGEVSEESDGPMEVAVPIRGDGPVDGATVRHLEATDAAIVEVPPDQCHFPAILGAYEAACQWLRDNGKSASEPPREIWNCDGGEMWMTVVSPYRRSDEGAES